MVMRKWRLRKIKVNTIKYAAYLMMYTFEVTKFRSVTDGTESQIFYVKHEIKTNQSSADTGNPFFSRRYRRRHQKNEDMSADTEKSQRCVSAELCCSPEVSSPISTVMLVKDNC